MPTQNSIGFDCRIVHVISSSQWRPITVRNMKDGRRSGTKVGWQVRPQGKRGWRRRLRLMTERHGTVFSARRQMCGRGLNVVVAKRAFQQFCWTHTCKQRCRRSPVGRSRHRQVMVKTRTHAYMAKWALRTESRESHEENKKLEEGTKYSQV